MRTLVVAIIVTSVFLVLFTIPVNDVAAQTLEYNLLVNLPYADETYTDDMSSYFVSVFRILIGVAAILAVIVLIWAGFEYVVGAANPQTRSDAKDRIIGALLGLLLALVAWIILNTINTRLVTSEITANPAVLSIDCDAIPGGGGGSPGDEYCIRYKTDRCADMQQACYNNEDDMNKAIRCYGLDPDRIMMDSGDYEDPNDWTDPHNRIWVAYADINCTVDVLGVTAFCDDSDCPGMIGVATFKNSFACSLSNDGDYGDKFLSPCYAASCKKPLMSFSSTVCDHNTLTQDPNDCTTECRTTNMQAPPTSCGGLWSRACASPCIQLIQECTYVPPS